MNTALDSFLRADDRLSADAMLGELVESEAEPVLRRVVAARLAGLWDDIEDVCSEARLELLLHLRRLKTRTGVPSIADFSAYVAAVAANACNRYFCRRRPGRARLKKQVRFLVRHEERIATRTSPDGGTLCDLAGRDAPWISPDPDALAGRVGGERDLGRLLVEILRRAGGALDLDQLSDVVARIWRIAPDPDASRTDVDLDSLPATSGDAETAIDRRRFTARLWLEITRLPREQRVSLLLHLRDRRGNSALFLFPMCGVATLPQIAAAMEMPVEQLSELWNRLPANDNSIASLLGCTRQRVINLRMAGRKRLANRMRATGQ